MLQYVSIKPCCCLDLRRICQQSSHRTNTSIATSFSFNLLRYQQKRTAIMRTFIMSLAAVGVSAAFLRASHLLSEPTLYDSQTAAEKFNYLMEKITGDTSPGSWPSTVGWPPASTLAYLFIESMKTTVQLVSDEMPEGRYKLIHSVGGAAAVKIVPSEAASKYTGLFNGANYGLIRLASATEPNEGSGNKAEESSFVPGFGIKFLRDGAPSGNIFFLHKLTPQDSWNFFKNPVSNHLTVGGLGTAETLLKKKFETSGSSWPTHVGLSDLARYAEDGTIYDDASISFPYQLVLVPDQALQTGFPDSYDRPLIDQLRTIPTGTTLYHIMAKPDYDSPLEKIGDLVTTSAIESSVYADSKLFLKHQIMEEDFALRPEWLDRCPKEGDCKVCPIDVDC